MKKYRIYFLTAALVIAALAIFAKVSLVRSDNLYGYATDKDAVNIRIDEFSVEPEASEFDGKLLTEALKTALRNRVSVKFNIVDNPDQADLIVVGKARKFTYLKKDPIDILIPIGLVIDLLTTQNYSRLKFDIEVHNTAEEKVVWKRHLIATVNKRNMSREASIPLTIERTAKVFVRKCFGRPKE